MDERRRHPRTELRMEVLVYHPQGHTRGRIEDIAAEGMFLRIEEGLKLLTPLEICVPMGYGTKPMLVPFLGTIVRMVNFGYGVHMGGPSLPTFAAWHEVVTSPLLQDEARRRQFLRTGG